MIRTFVGIGIPEDVAGALQAQQAGLPAGRAVPPENFHVTLAFLGEHPMPVVEDVHYALEAVSAPGFSIRLEGIGLFGERSRTVQALVRPEPGLTHLRARVLEAARSAGIPLPRARFQPHVTLARIAAGATGEDILRLEAFTASRAGFVLGPVPVDAFVLYRSRLGRGGAAYEAMATYPLAPP
jgi:RNA 2',3'-cyclic 3'-phosphodiesterase